jgi:hypothetical protein
VEYIVDEFVKRCWYVDESEWHNQGFEQAIASSKRCFPFIPLCNPDHIVEVSDIQIDIPSGLR